MNRIEQAAALVGSGGSPILAELELVPEMAPVSCQYAAFLRAIGNALRATYRGDADRAAARYANGEIVDIAGGYQNAGAVDSSAVTMSGPRTVAVLLAAR